MTIVTVHEAKTHLSRLIAEVLAGGEVVVSSRGKKPLVKLVAVEKMPVTNRVAGHLSKAGVSGVLDSGFWDPLPDDELALWNGAGD